LKYFNIIYDNFNFSNKNDIIDLIKEEFFLPNQFIYSQDQSNTNAKKIYLIVKGKVALGHNLGEGFNLAKWKVLKEKEIFGLSNFFQIVEPDYSVQSQDYTTCLSIS
jgi:hypothetical protein